MPTNLVKSGPAVRVELAVNLATGPGVLQSRTFRFDALKLEVLPDPNDFDPVGRFLLVRATKRSVAGETLSLDVIGDNFAGPVENLITSNRLEFLVEEPTSEVTASEIILSIVP